MGGLIIVKCEAGSETRRNLKVSGHQYKLKLGRSVGEFNLGPPEANEPAEAILALERQLINHASNDLKRPDRFRDSCTDKFPHVVIPILWSFLCVRD